MQLIKDCKTTDPQQKAEELTASFSIEKAIDISNTMLCYAESFQDDFWIHFWQKVISILEK